MVLCLVISCGNKTGKKRSNVEKVRFFRVLRVIVNQGQSTPKNLGGVYMRKLAPARVSYRHDFLISYRVYMMTGLFHI